MYICRPLQTGSAFVLLGLEKLNRILRQADVAQLARAADL